MQKALAGVARTATEARDQEKEIGESTRSILPLSSRVFFRSPLNALLSKKSVDEIGDFDPAKVGVERKDLGEDQPMSSVATKEGAFHVNAAHPYFEVLAKRAGQSRAAREFLRTFDLFAVSERLLEGHLFDIGIPDDEVAEIVEWREGLFRRIAASYDRAPEMINEMYRSSVVGGKPFEKALRRVFEDMGFLAHHDGRPGRMDVIVLATTGREGYSFTIEAKGSEHDVDNQAAAVGAAANHRDSAGADHAIIVSRKFAGFGGLGDRPTCAVLEECRATGGVSLMELEAVEKLHAAIVRFSYPLPLLRDVLMELECPAAKKLRIEALTSPVVGFDYRLVLEEIWHRQKGEARDDIVPYRSVFQQKGLKDKLRFPDFERRLIALDTLAAGRIRLDDREKTVYLRQTPELILDQIEKSLQGEGHDIPEGPED